MSTTESPAQAGILFVCGLLLQAWTLAQRYHRDAQTFKSSAGTSTLALILYGSLAVLGFIFGVLYVCWKEALARKYIFLCWSFEIQLSASLFEVCSSISLIRNWLIDQTFLVAWPLLKVLTQLPSAAVKAILLFLCFLQSAIFLSVLEDSWRAVTGLLHLSILFLGWWTYDILLIKRSALWVTIGTSFLSVLLSITGLIWDLCGHKHHQLVFQVLGCFIPVLGISVPKQQKTWDRWVPFNQALPLSATELALPSRLAPVHHRLSTETAFEMNLVTGMSKTGAQGCASRQQSLPSI